MRRSAVRTLAVAALIAASCVSLCRTGLAGTPARKFGKVGGYNQPALSPYLNLLNGNNSFEQNYFLYTQPQIQLRNAATDLGQSLGKLEGEVKEQERQGASSNLSGTGHTTSFLDTRGYFGGNGGGRGSAIGGNRAPTALRGANLNGGVPGIYSSGAMGVGMGMGMGAGALSTGFNPRGR